MTKLVTLIVGAHFRPPAKQLLAHLPTGAELKLIPDDSNEYDALAVKVQVDPQLVPASQWNQLDAELLETGNTVEQVLSAGPVQLGFVPAQAGKPLEKARALEPHLAGNAQVRELLGLEQSGQGVIRTQLAFGPDGSPRAEITFTPN
jgi:hypothetical protein